MARTTDRCRPPVQPMATVAYDFPSRSKAARQRASSSSALARNSWVSGLSSTNLLHRLVLAGQRRQPLDEERVGQEPHVQHHVGLRGQAVLEAERQHGDRQRRFAASVALQDQGAQRVHGQVPGVDHRGGRLAQGRQGGALGGQPLADVGARQRVPAPGLGEPADQHVVGGVQEQHLDGVPGGPHRLQGGGGVLQEVAAAGVDHQRRPVRPPRAPPAAR